MGRIRSVKPDLFVHERLFDAEQATGLPLRIAFIGLWTVACREGRFEWRTRALKAAVLPFDDVDFGAVLDALEHGGFIASYEVGGKRYGYVPSWSAHQKPNKREAQSPFPAPPDQRTCMHVHAPEIHVHARGERKGKEGEEEGGGGGRAHAREADIATEDEQSPTDRHPSNDSTAIDRADAQSGRSETGNAEPPDPQPPMPDTQQVVAEVDQSAPTLRERILEAMGCSPTGITGPGGRLVGGQADMLHVRRWQLDLGLTDDEIVGEVAAVMRTKVDAGPPATFAYFNRAMARLAGAKAAPRMQAEVIPLTRAGGTGAGRGGTERLSAHQSMVRAIMAVAREDEQPHDGGRLDG